MTKKSLIKKTRSFLRLYLYPHKIRYCNLSNWTITTLPSATFVFALAAKRHVYLIKEPVNASPLELIITPTKRIALNFNVQCWLISHVAQKRTSKNFLCQMIYLLHGSYRIRAHILTCPYRRNLFVLGRIWEKIIFIYKDMSEYSKDKYTALALFGLSQI